MPAISSRPLLDVVLSRRCVVDQNYIYIYIGHQQLWMPYRLRRMPSWCVDLGKLSKEGDASSAEMMTRLLKEMESETVQNALNKEYESFHKRPVIFADERFSIFCF